MNKYIKTLLLVLFVLTSISTSFLMPTKALATNQSAVAGAIIQSYNADPAVLTGMLVGLKPTDHTLVVPLSAKNSRNMLGVVVPASSTTLTLTPQSDANQQVLVATAGTYNVLVSNQNGKIKSGDYLTISSLSGIAMVASSQQQEIVGRAVASFSGGSSVIDTVPIKSSNGQISTVGIGRIAVDLRLAPNPLYTKSSTLPSVVSKTAIAIANKPVTLVQIYMSLILLLLTFFVTGTLYYSAVRNSILSIGRNPLSKKSIIAGLVKVLVVGLIIFGAGVLAAFLVIKS